MAIKSLPCICISLPSQCGSSLSALRRIVTAAHPWSCPSLEVTTSIGSSAPNSRA